jgi:uncharacterized membrane protein
VSPGPTLEPDTTVIEPGSFLGRLPELRRVAVPTSETSTEGETRPGSNLKTGPRFPNVYEPVGREQHDRPRGKHPDLAAREKRMSRETTRSIIVRRRADELFRMWSDVERLPVMMNNIVSVKRTGSGTSHWVARGPLGIPVEWDVETTLIEANKRIGWNSRNDGVISTTGQVSFNQLQQDQTEITVSMKVVPKGGPLVERLVNLLALPSNMIDEDLRAFKESVERLPAAGTKERDIAGSQ